jgi:Flp pilus assembly protein TadG
MAEGLTHLLKRFSHDRSGATAVYVSIAGVAMFGMGVLSLDVGQMVMLRNQMQNAADSAAIGAAAQLDGRSGAIQRATEVAQNLALDDSNLASNGSSLTVPTVVFYSVYDRNDPTKNVVTTVDNEAIYAGVTMAAKNLDFALEPAFDALTGQSDADFTTLNTSAVAENAQMDCDASPVFVCSSVDPSDTDSVFHEDNIGRQIVIKMGPGSPLDAANGNFGLLAAIDSDGDYVNGAHAVNDALEALTYEGCLTDKAKTAPGSQTNQVKWGFNSRFGTGNHVNNNYAADAILDFPRDTIFDSVSGGRGGADPFLDTDPAWTPETQWDPESFWYEMYQEVSGGTPVVDAYGDPQMLNGVELYDDVESDIINAHPNNPAGIVTRYGMYLHQLSDEATYIVEDNVTMTTNPDCSGQGACAGIERRKVKVAVVHCGDGTAPTQDVQGRDYIDVKGKYLDVFLTEEVEDPNSNAAVYAEIIGDASGDSVGAQDEISNVRLVD